MVFQSINSPDQNLQLVQSNITKAITPIENSPLIGGVLLKNISIISGQDNLISHTLNRMPVMAILGLPNLQSTIWSPVTASLSHQSSNSTYINLRCSTSCTVNLWVN